MAKDKILLRLYRQYSKDEAVAYMRGLIAPMQQEIGKLKSEVAELQYALEKKNMEPKAKEVIKKLQAQVKSREQTNNDLRFELATWRNKYLALIEQQKQQA